MFVSFFIVTPNKKILQGLQKVDIKALVRRLMMLLLKEFCFLPRCQAWGWLSDPVYSQVYKTQAYFS